MLNNLKKIYAFQSWDNFKETINFFKHNPHSIPGIAQLICKLGRHDYRIIHTNMWSKISILKCRHCSHQTQDMALPGIM